MVCGLTSATIMSERGKSTRQNQMRQNQALRCTSAASMRMFNIVSVIDLTNSSNTSDLDENSRWHLLKAGDPIAAGTSVLQLRLQLLLFDARLRQRPLHCHNRLHRHNHRPRVDSLPGPGIVLVFSCLRGCWLCSEILVPALAVHGEHGLRACSLVMCLRFASPLPRTPPLDAATHEA